MQMIEPTHKDWKCEICGGNELKSITLIPIINTENDGITEAKVFHVDCIDLVYSPFPRGIVMIMD